VDSTRSSIQVSIKTLLKALLISLKIGLAICTCITSCSCVRISISLKARVSPKLLKKLQLMHRTRPNRTPIFQMKFLWRRETRKDQSLNHCPWTTKKTKTDKNLTMAQKVKFFSKQEKNRNSRSKYGIETDWATTSRSKQITH